MEALIEESAETRRRVAAAVREDATVSAALFGWCCTAIASTIAATLWTLGNDRSCAISISFAFSVSFAFSISFAFSSPFFL